MTKFSIKLVNKIGVASKKRGLKNALKKVLIKDMDIREVPDIFHCHAEKTS